MEKLHEAEVAKLGVGPISEDDLTLSPLTASQLLTPRDTLEDKSGGRSEEPSVDVTSTPVEQVEALEKTNLEKDSVSVQGKGAKDVDPKDPVEISDTFGRPRLLGYRSVMVPCRVSVEMISKEVIQF
ncbi:hypothetical protein F2Q68_00039098 [Brassica cretica]|uniref:Uncharacterized protein n=1 Tax=Brassica cretica TaxID=69181 RepID=A0A8S9MPV9_BRACR|nr:hypothetical protein F2Q68_00039098 [Brassica cretica]